LGNEKCLGNDSRRKKIEIAKNAILEGADNIFIAKIMGLTVEQIEKLSTELKNEN
jgi:ribosomal protein L10